MTDLTKLATNLVTSGPVKLQSTPRRVRILFDGQYVVDTTSAKHVWEHKYYPQFYVPLTSVLEGVLKKGDSVENDSAFLATLKGKEKSSDRVIVFEKGPLEGLVRFEFSAMDAWFEEDEQIWVHPKDPYTRVDILPSSREIRVEVDGVTIAETSNALFLFETNLRTRFYMPKTSVNWKYLTESKTVTSCPYKGDAWYYNVTVNGKEHKDAIWWYKHPIAESARIAGYVCFYNEKVDIFIDGVKEEK